MCVHVRIVYIHLWWERTPQFLFVMTDLSRNVQLCVRLSLSLYQLQRSYNWFLTFYTSQHNGRKLNWLYQLSKVGSAVRGYGTCTHMC